MYVGQIDESVRKALEVTIPGGAYAPEFISRALRLPVWGRVVVAAEGSEAVGFYGISVEEEGDKDCVSENSLPYFCWKLDGI